MFKNLIASVKATWNDVRLKYRIKAYNEVIENSVKVREKAKQVALKAQAERDRLQAERDALAK